ncbi:MAG TPA: dihydrofolate reductase [Candidatus Limnocylindrales bacterium]|nr:dihydrofolate reductase [Candidatus Limnocylindrales bacterium]
MNKSRISIFAAIDEKNGLGKNNDLLFRIPEDFRRMKEITSGHPLVMGRKTFESLGRLLPNRTHIVITRDSQRIEKISYHPEAVVTSLEDGIEIGKKSDGGEEVFIFGGGEIFKQAIEKGLVDRLYLTVVEGDYGADVFFPEYPAFTKVISEEKKEADGYRYTFLILENN